eukprot:1139891-Pelagomonas_calceolata.AAC.5
MVAVIMRQCPCWAMLLNEGENYPMVAVIMRQCPRWAMCSMKVAAGLQEQALLLQVGNSCCPSPKPS